MFAATARRAYGRMSSPAVTAPYTRAVVNAMRKLYVHIGYLSHRVQYAYWRTRIDMIAYIDTRRFWPTRASTTQAVRYELDQQSEASLIVTQFCLKLPSIPSGVR